MNRYRYSCLPRSRCDSYSTTMSCIDDGLLMMNLGHHRHRDYPDSATTDATLRATISEAGAGSLIWLLHLTAQVYGRDHPVWPNVVITARTARLTDCQSLSSCWNGIDCVLRCHL